MSGATDLEQRLSGLGLTKDEARAYVALREFGRLTAREVCSITGVSRGRIYDVLGGLVSKGAILEAIGRPRSFEPAPPEAVVSNLIESRRTELQTMEQGAAELIEALKEELAGTGSSPTVVEAVHHKPTLVTRLDALVEEAKQEIIAFARPPFFAGVISTDYKAQFDAMARGVKVRGIYESVLLDSEDLCELIAALAEHGEESRHIESLPTKLFVVDRSVAVLPLGKPRTPDDATTLIVRHEGIGALLADAFEFYWERAAPVETLDASSGESSGD